jgi:hypothetical protein
MGKRDRLARAAKKKKKASVEVLGKGMGVVVETLDAHRTRQGERADVFKMASAEPGLYGPKSMTLPERMEQSCPMCGSVTIWECQCSDVEEVESACKADQKELEELGAAMSRVAVSPQTPAQQAKPVSGQFSCERLQQRVGKGLPERRILQMDTPVKPQ